MSNLQREYRLGDLILTDYPYSVVLDADLGEPSLDDEPRELSLTVGIEGADLLEVAENEAALRREINKGFNELAIDPGDGFGPTSVFETTEITARAIRFEDGGEQTCYRQWELSISADSHALSVDTTVSAALSVGGTLSQATIDACNSATGWTATRSGVADSASTIWEAGAVGVVELDDLVTSPEVFTLTRTGSASFASMPYLVSEVRHISNNSTELGVSAVTSTGATVSLSILSRRSIGSTGYHEVVCLVPGGATLASVTYRHVSAAGDPWQGLLVRNVSQTNMPPGTSARQLSRLIEVGGTERTPASLHASTSSGFLGTTFLHTMPFDGSGYTPDMRRWRASGNTAVANADTRRVTGFWEPLKPNPVVSRVPAHSLPRGGYVLMAAIKADTATAPGATHQIDWAVKSVTSGVVIGQTTGSKQWAFPTAHEMTFVPLAGDLSLPVVRSLALDVEVHLFNPSGTVALHVEEWWLFKVDDDCALTIVNTTEGNLWADSPDVNSPVPLVSVGPSKASSFHPGAGLVAMGAHTFLPGQVLTTTISDRNDYVEVDLSYRKRWHSNAAE